MLRLLLVFLFLSGLCFKVHALDGNTSQDKVALLIMLDMSSSTKNHRKKMKNLAPLVKKVMEMSRCQFKVGVGNIAYEDVKRNDLTPWGDPAFVTFDTPRAEELIWQRIHDPESVLFPYGTVSGDDETPRGSQEKTYSSMVDAIEQNLPLLEDTVSVGVLLLTDTVPAFENYSPGYALSRIHQALGTRTFIPGMIRPQVHNGMMVEHWDVSASSGEEQRPVCRLDIPGSQIPGSAINTFGWINKDLEVMDQFIDQAWGQSWDICDSDYDKSLEEYLRTVLMQSGCYLMM